jgi:uncharacterized protein YneF (UPF0154 family)
MSILVIIISMIAFFTLGRFVGRADAQRAIMTYLEGMYKRLPIEDKILFDKWVREYQQFLERK